MWERIFSEFLPASSYKMTEQADLEYYYENNENIFCELWVLVEKSKYILKRLVVVNFQLVFSCFLFYSSTSGTFVFIINAPIIIPIIDGTSHANPYSDKGILLKIILNAEIFIPPFTKVSIRLKRNAIKIPPLKGPSFGRNFFINPKKVNTIHIG